MVDGHPLDRVGGEPPGGFTAPPGCLADCLKIPAPGQDDGGSRWDGGGRRRRAGRARGGCAGRWGWRLRRGSGGGGWFGARGCWCSGRRGCRGGRGPGNGLSTRAGRAGRRGRIRFDARPRSPVGRPGPAGRYAGTGQTSEHGKKPSSGEVGRAHRSHIVKVRQRSSGPAMGSGALPATLRWVDGDRSRDDPRLAAFGGPAPIPCPVEDCPIDPGESLSPGRGLVGSGAGSAHDVTRHSSVRPSRHRVPSPSGSKCFTNSQLWQCSAPGPGASPISVGVSSRN